MSDPDAKLDKLLEHILDLKEAMAELRGAELPKRMDRAEKAISKHSSQWAKLSGMALVAGGLGSFLAHKLGLKP